MHGSGKELPSSFVRDFIIFCALNQIKISFAKSSFTMFELSRGHFDEIRTLKTRS